MNLTPNLNYSDIKDRAEEFLDFYHPDKTIPIPIEEILELNMKIHLISIPDLKHTFGIDGFINSRFDILTIDDYAFNNNEERARFTIAHEIGHVVLHKDLYSKTEFQTIDEYLDFQESFPNQTYAIMERQAETFAGCVLIPGETLKAKVQAANNSNERNWMFGSLPNDFKVSQHALLIQIEKEHIDIV